MRALHHRMRVDLLRVPSMQSAGDVAPKAESGAEPWEVAAERLLKTFMETNAPLFA